MISKFHFFSVNNDYSKVVLRNRWLQNTSARSCLSISSRYANKRFRPKFRRNRSDPDIWAENTKFTSRNEVDRFCKRPLFFGGTSIKLARRLVPHTGRLDIPLKNILRLLKDTVMKFNVRYYRRKFVSLYSHQRKVISVIFQHFWKNLGLRIRIFWPWIRLNENSCLYLQNETWNLVFRFLLRWTGHTKFFVQIRFSLFISVWTCGRT